MVLAQVDPTAAVAGGLAGGNATALAWALAIAGGVIVYLYKQVSDLRSTHAAELAALQKETKEAQKSDAKEQRELLMQIVPLSAKLTEGLESLERITDRLTRE